MASALSQGSWILERKEIPREILQGAEHSERSDCCFFVFFLLRKKESLGWNKSTKEDIEKWIEGERECTESFLKNE